MDTDELLELKKDIDDQKEEKARLEGQYKIRVDDLKKKGFKSLKGAIQGLDRMRKEADKATEAIAELSRVYQEKWLKDGE